MRSLPTSFLVLALTGAVLLPGAALAGARYFGSSGPSGHTIHGFTGGWGLNAGVEWPIHPAASFVVRADAHWLPDDATSDGGIGPAEVGFAAPGGATARLWSVLAGFRLQPGTGVVRGYADGLVGVGHLDAREAAGNWSQAPSGPVVRDDTNVALSLGAGLLLVPPGRLALFADAHYDFYGVPGIEGGLVPLRMGVRFE